MKDKKEQSDIKAKVARVWTHRGKPTVVGETVDLSLSQYVFCLEKKVVEESPDQPKMLEV